MRFEGVGLFLFIERIGLTECFSVYGGRPINQAVFAIAAIDENKGKFEIEKGVLGSGKCPQ